MEAIREVGLERGDIEKWTNVAGKRNGAGERNGASRGKAGDRSQ